MNTFHSLNVHWIYKLMKNQEPNRKKNHSISYDSHPYLEFWGGLHTNFIQHTVPITQARPSQTTHFNAQDIHPHRHKERAAMQTELNALGESSKWPFVWSWRPRFPFNSLFEQTSAKWVFTGRGTVRVWSHTTCSHLRFHSWQISVHKHWGIYGENDRWV